MRNKILFGITILLAAGICFAEEGMLSPGVHDALLRDSDIVSVTPNALFLGSDKGYEWSRAVTRGEARALFIRNDGLQQNKLDTLKNAIQAQIVALPRPRYYETEIVQLADELVVLTEKLQKTREQIAYIVRVTKKDIAENIEEDIPLRQAQMPWAIKSSALNYFNGNSLVDITGSYSFYLLDPDFILEAKPTAGINNSGIYFGITGELRFGTR